MSFIPQIAERIKYMCINAYRNERMESPVVETGEGLETESWDEWLAD